MSEVLRESAALPEAYFDRTPPPFGDGPPDPLVYDAAPRALRQRTVNFAAKHLVDMRYVIGLDRATAERHFRWRPAAAPGGLGFRITPTGRRNWPMPVPAATRRGLYAAELIAEQFNMSWILGVCAAWAVACRVLLPSLW
jgi:hypothetical protein